MNRERVIKGAMLVLAMLVGAGCGSGGGSDPATTSPSPAPVASLLYTTATALMRVNTDGTGVVTLDDTHDGIWQVVISGNTVTYQFSQVPYAVNHNDIWTVETNGTNLRQLVRDTQHHTSLRDVIASWVLYAYRTGPSFQPPPPALASIQLDGTASRIIMDATGAGENWQAPNYARQIMGRAVVEFAGNYFSLLPDGTDLRQLTVYPPFPHLNNEPFTVLGAISGVVGTTAIYSTFQAPSSPISAEGTPKLFAVPVLGGPVVKLGEGPEMEMFMGAVGTRLVYQRCVMKFLPNFDVTFDRCNVSSVLSTGQGRIALTETADINYVQGVIGSQVILRRSHGRPTDELFSLLVTGGAETPILTLDYDDEFVIGIVQDRLVLQRQRGLWSVRVDGSELVQLTSDTRIFTVQAVGAFACFNRGVALWCVPADGSAGATKVADEATAIIGLD